MRKPNSHQTTNPKATHSQLLPTIGKLLGNRWEIVGKLFNVNTQSVVIDTTDKKNDQTKRLTKPHIRLTICQGQISNLFDIVGDIISICPYLIFLANHNFLPIFKSEIYFLG